MIKALWSNDHMIAPNVSDVKLAGLCAWLFANAIAPSGKSQDDVCSVEA
jgi:hypothetical protein